MPSPARRTAPGRVARQLREQARSCAAMGSPLYAALLDHAADDAAGGGPVLGLLAASSAPGDPDGQRGGAVALRFMAAVHRLVLTGRAPDLARHYPSVGGDGDADAAKRAFVDVCARQGGALRPLVALPCQTNEVGRCAALLGGFLTAARHTGLGLRLLEVGASAGLNLRWDAYRYDTGAGAWGPPASPARLEGLWERPPPLRPAAVDVVGRRGCDPRPVDPTSPEGRLTLTASVWADQPDRIERLRGALAVAGAVSAPVDAADVTAWLPARLAETRPGAATVVYHSVVEEYLPAATRAWLRAAVADAGRAATPDAPLAWLRMEPATALRVHEVTLTVWPGGRTRRLATCGAHGQRTRWSGEAGDDPPSEGVRHA